MNRLVKSLCTLALLWAMAPSVQAQPSDTLNMRIREMMEVTGMGNLSLQVMQQMIPSMKQAYPQVPDKFWTEFMQSVDAEELMELIVPIYARHFTLEDIEDLLAFYKQPVGQKLLQKTPVIMQESMVAGQQWGAALGEKVAKKIVEEGY